MKRARGGDELCACGHVACKKIVNQLYGTVDKHLKKLNQKKNEKNDAKQLKALGDALNEAKRQMGLMEELNRQHRVHLAEFYKQKIVNVTLKREIPLKKAASDMVEPPPPPKKKKK